MEYLTKRPLPDSSQQPGRKAHHAFSGIAVIVVILALILSITAAFASQRLFKQQRVGGGPGVSSLVKTTTPVATARVEVANSGWSRVWAFPIPRGDSNGANPFLSWSPAQPQTLYLCLYGQPLSSLPREASHLPLLFRSLDGGATWHTLALPEPAARCAMYPDPVQSGRIVLVDDRNGAYFSRDAGASWQAIPQPPGHGANHAAFESIAGGRIYVGAYWTSDLHTWTRWFFGQPSALTLAPVVDPLHPDTMYSIQQGCANAPSTLAGASMGVCRSDDGGQSWRYLLSTITQPGPPPTICLLPSQPTALFAWSAQLMEYGATLGSFARSDDGGATWTAQGLPQESQPPTFPPAALCSSSTGFYGSPLGGVDSVRDDGTLYTTIRPTDGDTRPNGVILYRNGAWQVAAPAPLRATTSAPPSVVWTPQGDGRYLLLAVSDSALYRYDTVVAP